MVNIKDTKLIEMYISKNRITEVFTEDMRPYMELLLFKKNEHICREGEEIKYLYFFVDGKAKVYTTLSNGKSLLLCFYQGFRVLGELEVIDFQSATTNIQVIEDSYCIGITYENVGSHLLNDSKFLRFICASLGAKLNRCSKNSSINLLHPMENRLASYILANGERRDRDGEVLIEFNENLTEISELLGTSYRHLLRTFNTLCQRGCIMKKNNDYVIRDKSRLMELALDLYQ